MLIAYASFVTPASAGDAAQEQMRRGVELRKDNRDRDALREFQEAYALSPAAGIRAQIGLAEQALGEWTSSESDLQAALQADDPWIARNRQVLDQALEFVNSQLGWVDVHCNVNGAELVVNDSPVGRTPTDNALRTAAMPMVCLSTPKRGARRLRAPSPPVLAWPSWARAHGCFGGHSSVNARRWGFVSLPLQGRTKH